MEDEDLVMPVMGASSTDDDLVMPSMEEQKQRQPSIPKLPANMNPQQVKSFFSKAGKALTDTQARDIASMVSGKSYKEAMALTSDYLAPKVTAPVQEQAPLVAAPQPGTGFTGQVEGVQVNTTQKQEPDLTFNTVAAEIARPKTVAETQDNVAQTMIDGYKSKDKDLDYLFQLLDDGKLANIDLGPLGTIGLGELTQQRKEKIKSDLLSIKSAEGVSSKITNLATIKALQEESTKNIANLTNEVKSLQQDPMHDPKVLEKKKKELYDQVIINQVSNNTQKPFEEKQRLKSIADAQAAIDALSFKQRAYIGTKNASMEMADLGLTMLNSVGEFINKYSPEALTGRVMESYIEEETGVDYQAPITTAGGSALKEFSRIKKEELEDYRKSNKTEYLAGQVSILDGLNAVNVGKAVGQTLGSMGAVIGGSIAGGPTGGIAVGYSLVYGDAVDAARKAGFNETESEIYGQILAIGSGLLEELPVGKLLEGWSNTMLKRSVLNTIRTELKAGTPKAAIAKKVLDQTLETTAKGIQQGLPEGITEVAQGGQEYLTQLAYNNYLNEKEDPGFELPTLKEFGKQSAEAFVLGFFGGGGASVFGDVVSGTQSYSKLAAAAIKDNESFNNLNLVADGLYMTDKITEQEYNSFNQNLKIAKEAKAALPKYIKDDNVRQRSIELILDKKRLEADMATVDPSMLDGYKAKLTSIQSELKSIADQKWKAPSNPVIFSSVSGLEAMTTALVNNSSKENSAGTFVSTVESGKGFINDLMNSIDENDPIAMPLVERTVNSLEILAKTFAEAPVKTEMTQKAAQKAQELADQLKSYANISETVEEKIIPGLDISLAADRIALGVPIADLDFMGDVPVDIQEAYQGIMSGDEVSSEDANNVQDVLYSKYKELSDIKQKVQDKLENTTSRDKQRKLSESINAISEIQANLSEDIGMIGRYRDETRINEESTGQVQETKTKPVEKKETKKEQAGKLSNQQLADMEYDYSNPSEEIVNMIDEQPDAAKIYKLLNGAIKFINKIAPNVKIYVHATSQEFYDVLDISTGNMNPRLGDDGMYVGGTDGKPESVHFNLESMLGNKDAKKRAESLRTFAHEAMHVGLQSIFGDDQNLFQSFQDKLSKVLKSADMASLNDFVSLYEGETYTAEEFLAELTAMMSAEGRNIPKPILARIAQLINNTIVSAARKLGITVDSNLLFKDTMDTNDVIDFFNTMAESARTGITQGVKEKTEPLLKQQDLNNIGVSGEINSSGVRPRKDTKSLLSSGDIKRFPVNPNTKVQEDVPLSKFNAKKTNLIESDRMTGGYVADAEGNPLFKFYGGVFYPIITGKWWASRNETKAKAIVENGNKNRDADGYVYCTPMIGSDKQHMSNTDMLSVTVELMKHDVKDKKSKVKKADIVTSLQKAFNRKDVLNKKSLLSSITGKSRNINEIFDELEYVLFQEGDKILKRDGNPYLDEKGKALSNFSFEERLAIVNTLLGDPKVKDVKFPSAGTISDAAKRFEEPITSKAKAIGDVVTVMRTKGTLVYKKSEADDMFYHKSYPVEINAVDEKGNPAEIEVYILDGAYSMKDIFPSLTQSSGKEFTWEEYIEKHKSDALAAAQYNRTAKLSSATGEITVTKEEKDLVDSNLTNAIDYKKESGTTQRPNTTNSYIKAANLLKEIGADTDVLDYGAGLGLGTDAMSSTLGSDVDSYEPNPERWKGKKNVTFVSSNDIDKKYKSIVSLNVLNVVEKDIRDSIVKDIFNHLDDNGVAVISARKWNGDVNQAKNAEEGGEKNSLYVSLKQDGKQVKVFQKGFDGNELVDYISDLLGDKATVEKNNSFGATGVVIKKNAEPTTMARKSQANVTDKIAQLREQEQAENDATDPDDQAKRIEIYDRYDKLITPLLEQEKVDTGAVKKVKVFRGTGNNVRQGKNDAIQWVAEDRRVAENYSEGGKVEEMEVVIPSNPFEMPFNAIQVRGVDIANRLRTIRDKQLKDKSITRENAVEISKYISDFENKAGNELELYSTKTNKKESSVAFVTALKALGFNGLVQKESYNSGSPFTNTVTGNETNTYGIFKEQSLPTQETTTRARKSKPGPTIKILGEDYTELFDRSGISFMSLNENYGNPTGDKLTAIYRETLLRKLEFAINYWDKEKKKQGEKLKLPESSFNFRQTMLSKYSDRVARLTELKDKIEEDLLMPSDIEISENVEATTRARKSQSEDQISINNVAQNAGVSPKNIRDLYKVNRELFSLNQVKALASAVAMDRMISVMAKRAGVTKPEMYGRLKFEKANQQDLPQGIKFQVDAWHGSPYEFDKFQTEFMGKGEGNQAFGWGLYFTDIKSIAENYADTLSSIAIQAAGITQFIYGTGYTNEQVNDILSKNPKERISLINEAYDKKVNKVKSSLDYQKYPPYGDEKIETFTNLRDRYIKDAEKNVAKSVYKVTLFKGKTPDQYNLLEWDKTVSDEVKAKVKEEFTKLGISTIRDGYKSTSYINGEPVVEVVPPKDALEDNFTGKQLYEYIALSFDGNLNEIQKEASLLLLRAGVDGIKYPAESIARGATSETTRGFNYVVFDENAVSIEEVIKFQKDAEKARGAMMITLDGQATIYALTDPNVSTPLHELAHVFEHYLTDGEKKAVMDAAKTKEWNIKTSEYFARGFEKYLAEGKSPIAALDKIFAKFKEWLTDIYNGILGSDIDIELNDEMRNIYAQMLGDEIVNKPTTRARRTQANKQYYNKARAADQGTKADRDNQAKIYDKAKAFLDTFYASGGVQKDEHDALYVYLSDNGFDIDPNDLFELRFDIEKGERPNFSENKGGKGYAQPKGEETRKSRVLDRIKTKLEGLASDRSLNRKIVNKLKESLHYTVQNQDDAMRIAQMVIDEFGGINGLQDVSDLFDISREFEGAIKTFIVGNVLNEAYKNAKKAVKGSEEQKRYQAIVNDASTLLAERARNNGREIAALYKVYLNSSEGMYTIEAKKFLQDVESAFNSKSQKQKIDDLIKELKDAKDEAARLATEVASVRAAIATATGGPVAPTPSAPKPPKPPKPQAAPLTPTQANLKKERSLYQQLKDRLKALGLTRPRRQYPAGVDADVVDILSELARVNFERGIFDYFDIKDAIAKKLAKDNITISDEHYSEMWQDIWREAANAQIAFNAEILAKRIVFKAKQTAPLSAPMTDPIKLIKDELFKRATQDIKDFDVDNETEFDKLRRLLFFYGSMTKPIWNESKDAVRRQIDALDPTKYSPSAKAELRRKLDNFFNDTIANALPRSQKKITATFEEEVKSKELKIKDVLLKPNETIASNREEFVRDLVDRLVSQAGISYAEAQAITQAFTKEYDALAQKTSEKILARSVPKNKSKDKILNKSNAEKAFEMIKYGAIDPNASLTDKDGNLTDLNDLFSDIFGLPKMNDEIRGNLKAFAEQIAKTKPNSILRQQFYNDMMSYIEYQKIKDSMGMSIIMAQIYHNVLFSMDTMIKAFNSNVINTPHEFVTQALRATVEGDFSLIPLIAKSYFGKKGDKNTEMWFREGMNNAKLTLAGMVETDNFNTSNVAEVLSKHAESPSLRAWGRYARKSNRFLGSIDTLFTSAATGARLSDLLYDEIKYLAKQNNVVLTSKQIADTVANIQGLKFDPNLAESPVKVAIRQATDEFKEAYGTNVDINSKKNIALFRARVLEIIREGTKQRAADYIVNNRWASELDGARIDEIISTAKDLASKVGLVGNPPGTAGILAYILKFPGKAMPGSQLVIGNMFANAPVNAAEKILQGNTAIGLIVLGTRLLKNQRGILNDNEMAEEFYNNEGIRTEMYGRITSRVGNIDVNMEKKELIIRYVMLQSVLLPLSYMSTTAIAGAIASALDDDDERKEDLIKNGIGAIGKISENERHRLFFGDKTADAGTEEYNGQWKKLKLYVTGPMYGYSDPGSYSKMSAMKSMYGIEPYSIYSYGRLVTRYNDNPLLAAMFGSVGANNDVVLFNNDPERPTETYTQMIMQSAFLQLSLVKDQSAIKPVMEWADAIQGKGIYSAPDLGNAWDRFVLAAQKKGGSLASNALLPAEAKNFNQDMKSFMGMTAKDPREFYDFITFRAPIMDIVIKNEKTDSFNFPIEEKTKRVLPIGTQGLIYSIGPDGVLNFPQVDKIMNGPGGKYYAMFKKYDNDQFDKPGIFNYIERDDNNSGESKVKSLTISQLSLVRDEYKKIMREFCDNNYENLKSGTKSEFTIALNMFLANYRDSGDYKDYILKKVVGENAFVDQTIEENINEGIDEQFRERK